MSTTKLDETNPEIIYTKDDLQVIYTNKNLSEFLGVPIHTKTNMYTVLKRIRQHIHENNLCINGVIKPDQQLSSILHPNHKYNRIIYNTLSRYIINQ